MVFLLGSSCWLERSANPAHGFSGLCHVRYLNRSCQIQAQATVGGRESFQKVAGLMGISADQFCNGKRVTANSLHVFNGYFVMFAGLC